MANTSALTAYAARAAEYAEKLGTLDAVHSEDRALISTWARVCRGTILDVGCGPGHWTDLLRREGHDVEGLDPVPEFVSRARSTFPDASFRQAWAEDLGVSDGEVGGILAWYSLIHTTPERLEEAFTEFARALRPGGKLLIGFFEWPSLELFPHAVAHAYRWPVGELAARLESTGFAVEETVTRHDHGSRPHGAITARRLPSRPTSRSSRRGP